MKQKNGFTLIELLAIIVILAIIAVITVPIILNIIDESKKGAAKDSAYGFKESIQKYYVTGILNSSEQELPSGYIIVSDLPSDFSVNGDEPSSDSWIQLDKGQVVAYSLKFGDYTVTKYTDTDVVCEKGNVQENEETRAARLKLAAKTQAATDVSNYISSLLADSTVQGYTSNTSKKVSEISSPSAPTGVDGNSWVYFSYDGSAQGDKVSITDYSIKITVNGYTFVVNCVDGVLSEPIESNVILSQKNSAPDPVSFATDSWATIKRAINEDNTSLYSLGDTKEVVIDNDSYTIRLSNMSFDGCDTQANVFSQTACGFVFEFIDVLNLSGNSLKIRTSGSTSGGWPASDIYKLLNTNDNNIFSKLPLDLQGVIADTYTVSGHDKNEEGGNLVSTSKLYLLSRQEVLGDNSADDTAYDVTRQLEYYHENSEQSDRIKYTVSSSANTWWTRTPSASGSGVYRYIKNNGDSGNTSASNQCGIAPAFRIVKD